MKLATYLHNGQQCVGLVSQDHTRISRLQLSESEHAAGVLSLIDKSQRGEAFAAVDTHSISMEDVKLLAPIPRPRRNIFCVGRNYHAHAKELAASVFKDNDANPNAWPIVFTKVPECITGPFDNVELPSAISEQIDYEAELAVVIGTGGKNISREQAMSHVVGDSRQF